jgi:hypothetical protein
MRAGTHVAEGAFGLNAARLTVQPGTNPELLAIDALALLEQGLAVFEAMTGADDVSDTHFAGLYLLRQAAILLDHAQLTTHEGEAVLNLRGAA